MNACMAWVIGAGQACAILTMSERTGINIARPLARSPHLRLVHGALSTQYSHAWNRKLNNSIRVR